MKSLEEIAKLQDSESVTKHINEVLDKYERKEVNSDHPIIQFLRSITEVHNCDEPTCEVNKTILRLKKIENKHNPPKTISLDEVNEMFSKVFK